jgi:hypothetical protein
LGALTFSLLTQEDVLDFFCSTSSVNEFQEPQLGHLPSHLGDWKPQL